MNQHQKQALKRTFTSAAKGMGIVVVAVAINALGTALAWPFLEPELAYLAGLGLLLAVSAGLIARAVYRDNLRQVEWEHSDLRRRLKE